MQLLLVILVRVRLMETTTNKGSYRLQLRQDTHEYHVILNHHPLLIDLTKPTYPLTHYKTLLFAYSQLYRSIEELIDHFLQNHHVDFDYSERKKLPGLIKDIGYFAHDDLKLDLPELPKLSVPQIDNISELAGLLYVVEGATLGGQHISRALSDFHGMTFNTGACFFNSYGEKTIMRWEVFLQFLDLVIQDENNFQNAKDTACRTFQTFQMALDYYLPILSE